MSDRENAGTCRNGTCLAAVVAIALVVFGVVPIAASGFFPSDEDDREGTNTITVGAECGPGSVVELRNVTAGGETMLRYEHGDERKAKVPIDLESKYELYWDTPETNATTWRFVGGGMDPLEEDDYTLLLEVNGTQACAKDDGIDDSFDPSTETDHEN